MAQVASDLASVGLFAMSLAVQWFVELRDWKLNFPAIYARNPLKGYARLSERGFNMSPTFDSVLHVDNISVQDVTPFKAVLSTSLISDPKSLRFGIES